MSLLRNRYQIIRQIGQGGFGKTYLAQDLDKLNEPCVVKQLSPQVEGSDALQKAVVLFEDEAKRLRDLGEHPQIPMLYAYFEEDKNFYLVQQFIEGKNLAEDLQDEGLYGKREIIDLLTKLLPVLKFVHQRQVIHRDVKPENIIRCNNDRLVLVDFGASKYLTSPILKTGTVIGTAGYVSPEQAVGKPVFSSDLYSLGVTCVHLLTGVEPFQLYDASEGEWVWRDYLTQPINNSLGQVLDKMLEPAKRRFQSADEVLQALSSGLTVVRQQQSEQNTQSISLKSNAGVDYSKLRDLLAAGLWKQADELTAQTFVQISGRNFRINREDIEKFPCQDLDIINRLWSQYSNGRFGFSAQKKVWFEVGGDIKKLRKQVGWINWTGTRAIALILYKLYLTNRPFKACWIGLDIVA
jgi:serine/threonine protein kinase